MKKEQDKTPEVVAKTARTERTKVAPLMRFSEDEHAFVLRLNLPGVEQTGLQVQTENNTLTIEARREESAHAELKCVRQEFPIVDYRAAYELPDDVDPTAINAKLAHGVLTVTLKKREAAKPQRIAVSVD